jgi:hypothetical protein
VGWTPPTALVGKSAGADNDSVAGAGPGRCWKHGRAVQRHDEKSDSVSVELFDAALVFGIFDHSLILSTSSWVSRSLVRS